MFKSVISITTPALKKLSEIAHHHQAKNILFSVRGGGCNGFTYDFSPTNDKPSNLDEIYHVEDQVTNYNTPLKSIHVCGNSLMHLLGTEIDWKKDIMGETFVFNNPMAQSSCGCGTSFNSKK